MQEQTQQLAIVFADIVGSTALYDNLGDIVARRLMASCLATLSAVVKQHHGVVVKTIGDEIMCSFPSAQAGLQAACAMQMALQNTVFEGNTKMQIRAGCHFGKVICEAGDVFGDTVNVAARVASTARANQIMTSLAVVEAISADLRSKTHRIMSAEFKGKQTEYDIYIVAWNTDDTEGTHIQAPQVQVPQESNSSLQLSYASRQFCVNKERKNLSLGRSEVCDLVINSSLASRQHAAIEMRFGKFFVVDQSANGTYIRTSDGSVKHISRQEMLLQGHGQISLGIAFSENPVELIQFSIV